MKIVSLDDHPLFSDGLKASLSALHSDFDIITLANPQETLIYLKGNLDTDLLILDLAMPEMDGLTFMRAMLARDILTPVVLMSAQEDLVILRDAIEIGVLGFLPKNWTASQLVEALLKINNGEPVFPDHIAAGLAKMAKPSIELARSTLSKRQLEILKMVQSGLSNKGIAEVLYISEVTVKSHLQSTFRILGAKNRIDMVRKAESLNILPKR